MKLTFVLTTVCLLSYSAEVASQNVSFSGRNVPIESVFRAVEKQTGLNFLYKQSTLRSARPVTVNAKNVPLEKFLVELFGAQPMGYSVKFNNILVSPKVTISQPGVTLSDSLGIVQTVSGRVTDSLGTALPGVTVAIKGTKQGTSTNANGNYTLSDVENEALLIFSFVGMKTIEVAVSGRTVINVVMTADITGLDEVVAVGYGTQRLGNLTGSVSFVNSRDLTVAPIASTSNTLAGRLPGLISLQSSGRPGYDAASLSIRGFGAALVIVDGVESPFNNIDPNQIESISILKDGAASIYGSRAGNGVILVTTKRGKEQRPDININSSYTLQGITAYSKMVSSGQYAELTNERYSSQGLPVPYTDEQVQKYYDGTDPQYPNTDWYKEVIRDWAPQQQHNLSVRGGSDKVRYYGFFGYTNQEYMWRRNGGNYRRYNLQSNIDAKVTENLTIQLDISSAFENRLSSPIPHGPGTNSVWQELWNTLPVYPARLPDPTKLSYANAAGVGSITYSTDMDIVGYDKGADHNLKGTFAADYKVPGVEGLSARAFVNYSQIYTTFKKFLKPYDFYTYDYSNDTYTLVGSYGTAASLTESRSEFRTLTGQLSLNYERTFSGDHHLKAMVLYEAIDYWTDYLSAGRANFLTPAIEYIFGGASDQSTTSGSGTEMGRASYVGRLNYSYKNKYLLESSIRADASAQFPSEYRWGYFPSISLGWRMNREYFMRNANAFDDLKLRLSYGSSGQDNVSNFAYLSGYQLGGQWLIGPSTQVGISSTGLANPLLTWEKIKIYNAGVDFSLWNRRLFGALDVFYRDLSGIPATRILSLPTTFGAALPPENINSQNSRGIEFSLGFSGQARDFRYEVTGNLSWSRSKWDHFEEPVYTDPDQIRISQLSRRWTDVRFGYVSDGIFNSQAEIDNLGFTYPGGNTSLGPGDIRYVDANKDNVLDWKDQVIIGKGTVPHWMTGVNINLSYKNFALSSLFQGALGYYSYVTLDHGNLTYPVEVYNLRWTETKTGSTALLPRIGGASSNQLYSDFYYKDASYLRLKVLSFSYSLPQRLVSLLRLKELRFYFAGTNLLTFSKLFKDYNVDPEAPTNNAAFYYPQQKTVSLGVNVSF